MNAPERRFEVLSFEDLVAIHGRSITHGAHFAEYTGALRAAKSLAKLRKMDVEELLDLVRAEYESRKEAAKIKRREKR